jgi:hypothetical protein
VVHTCCWCVLAFHTLYMQARGHVSLDSRQRAEAEVELQPADMPGILRASGTAQLPSYRLLLSPSTVRHMEAVQRAAEARSALHTTTTTLQHKQEASSEEPESDTSSTVAETYQQAQVGAGPTALCRKSSNTIGSSGIGRNSSGRDVSPELEVELTLRDGGLALLCALVPGCEWQGGSVQVDLRAAGPLLRPQVQGEARVTRGTLAASVLRSPLTNLSASIQVGREVVTWTLVVDNL